MNSYWWRKTKNKVMNGSLWLSGVIVAIPLVLIFSMVIKNGFEALSWDFLTNLPKPVGETGGGILHALVGSTILISLGGLIGITWGVLVGVYLSEYGRGKIAFLLRFAVDLLTGIPSIILGIFIYTLMVLPFKGFSAVAGGCALSLIIFPIVARSTEEVLGLFPQEIREAGLALGLPRWKVIHKIVVWGNRHKILTGVFLALARASGETAPLLFTAFGSLYLSWNLFGPMASLPVQIYNYAISPYPEWHAQAWAGAFILITIVLLFNLVAKLILNKGLKV